MTTSQPPSLKRIFISKDGRLWKEVRRDPHTTKDGRHIELSVWHTRCCIDGCSNMVEIRTPISAISSAFGAIHCSAHKLSKEEAAQRWLASMHCRTPSSARRAKLRKRWLR